MVKGLEVTYNSMQGRMREGEGGGQTGRRGHPTRLLKRVPGIIRRTKESDRF